MKLCIEGDIYFIPKFHILETETVKLSIETGLTGYARAVLSPIQGLDNCSRGYHLLKLQINSAPAQ
jgi:hypothetical protein